MLGGVRESLPQTLASLEVVTGLLLRYRQGIEQVLVLLPQVGSVAQTTTLAFPGEAHIDLARSWVIGDHANDMRLAANAGCHGILLLTGHGTEEQHRLADAPVDAIVGDLLAAAQHIVGREGRRPSPSPVKAG